VAYSPDDLARFAAAFRLRRRRVLLVGGVAFAHSLFTGRCPSRDRFRQVKSQERFMRASRFLGVFFVVHLLASVSYYFLLSGRVGAGAQDVGSGRVGMGVFGGMLFLLTNGQSTPSTPTLAFLILLNSALTAAVATGIFLVVRRLRAA